MIFCETCNKPLSPDGGNFIKFVIRFEKSGDLNFKIIYVCDSKCSYNFTYKYSEYMYPKMTRISEDKQN